MSETIAESVEDGQRVLTVKSINGTVLALNQNLCYVMVDTGSGKQLCVAVKQYGIDDVLRYKGSVATYNDLPSSTAQVGDVYNVLEDGKNYAWTGTAWDDFGGTITFSIATASDVSLTDLANGQLLIYDSTAEKWKNGSFPTVDQTYNSASTNAQSGAAISNAKFLQNTSSANSALGILGSANGNGGVGIGADASAGGSMAVGIGSYTGASGSAATAVGCVASASNTYATAYGASSKAQGQWSTALGSHALASGNYSLAIGGGQSTSDRASATANGSIAIGSQSSTSNTDTVVIGFGATTTYQGGTCLGTFSHAYGKNAVAIGNGADVYPFGVSIGRLAGQGNIESGGHGVISIGNNANSTSTLGNHVAGNRSVALGNKAGSIGTESVAIGGGDQDGATSGGADSVAIGRQTVTGTDTRAHAIDSSYTKTQKDMALGFGAIAYGGSAIQIGYGTNSTAKSLSVGFYDATTPVNYTLLDGSGIIPIARLGATAGDTNKFLRGDGTWQDVGGGSQPTYNSSTNTLEF